MVNECWIGKDEERNGYDMFEDINPNSSGGPEENHEKAQDNYCHSGDSNCISPEYKSEVLPHQPACSV
jgi:hypothetical protein